MVIYDLARVYVQVKGETFITNGPLLGFQVGGKGIGDTIDLEKSNVLMVYGKAKGRVPFGKLQLIMNGQVVAEEAAESTSGHSEAQLTWSVRIDKPRWLALRVRPFRSSWSEYGYPLFAHTSAVYVTFGGKPVCLKAGTGYLTNQVREAMALINKKGSFANERQRTEVLDLYKRALEKLDNSR